MKRSVISFILAALAALVLCAPAMAYEGPEAAAYASAGSPETAAVKNGLLTVGGKLYYLNASGVMQKNKTVTVNGKTYYIGADGVAVLQSNLFKKGEYRANGTGALDSDTLTIESKSGNTIVFSARWIMGWKLDHVRATISGNRAVFSTSEGNGYFTAGSGSVTLTINDSILPILIGTQKYAYFGTLNEAKTDRNKAILGLNDNKYGWQRSDRYGPNMLIYFGTQGQGRYWQREGIQENYFTPGHKFNYSVGPDRLYINGNAYSLTAESFFGLTYVELKALGKYKIDFSGYYELSDNFVYQDMFGIYS